MSVLLIRSTAPVPRHDTWAAIAAPAPRHFTTRERRGLAVDFDVAFEKNRTAIWALGKSLAAGNPTATLAHAPAGSPNVTDLGIMIAWADLVRAWASETAITLVICDDPWVFRHLAAINGVAAKCEAPPMARTTARLALRGFLARARAGLGVMAASLMTRGLKRNHAGLKKSLLVYGHPAADADGHDGYFATLMTDLPGLKRALHTDCGAGRARALGRDGRSASLHAWGSIAFALSLPWRRWRIRTQDRTGPFGWLVRRAEALEGGTGQGAMLAWQAHCQRRWLAATRPEAVAWPWENHSWERDFVRAARARGTETIGYQHAIVGPHLLNYGTRSNPDGDASVPDRVLCNGAATARQIEAWGVDGTRITVAGALRFAATDKTPFDADGPIFLAVPCELGVASEMLDAIKQAADALDRDVLVKDHPLTPFAFTETARVRRTDVPLTRQPGVSAVVYAVTTVGLEAILMGLPTVRFLPARHFAMNPLPDGVTVTAADAGALTAALANLAPAMAPDRNDIFAQPDKALWRRLLG